MHQERGCNAKPVCCEKRYHSRQYCRLIDYWLYVYDDVTYFLIVEDAQL